MDPAVRSLIDQPFLHLKIYEEIGRLLPQDDAELDRWLAESVAAGDSKAFMALAASAIGAGRQVDGRHLVRGAVLVTEPVLLGCFAWHMTGDVPEHFLTATQDGSILPAYAGMAYLAITAICHERRGGVYPAELIPRVRVISRSKDQLGIHVTGPLYAIAEITRDPALATILEIKGEFQWEKAKEISTKLKAALTGSPLKWVHEGPNREIARGVTMRRAVPRIGRNEPCPCQSGRKYKNCCMARDAERLQDSSHIAGKSQSDLRADPEPYLTKESLNRGVKAHEVVRFDPRKIAPELLEDFFFVLCAYSLFERAIECFEILGFPESLDQACDNFLVIAARAGRSDAIQRLMEVHPRASELQEDTFFGAKLAMTDRDPVRLPQVMEAGALETLGSEDSLELALFGFSWLRSRMPATGILIARGLIASMDDEAAQRLLDEIAIARDKLALSPDDPAGDILEKRLLEKTRADEVKDSAESRALAEARERLGAKAREVDFLRRSLETARQDVKRRERQAAPSPAAPSVSALAPDSAAADDRALRDLRFKIQKLKGELKGRHEERLALRHELKEAHARLETNPSRSAGAPGREADPEAEHVLPTEPAEVQPVRLPEFPRKFAETLDGLPRHVARNAMATIGRLASGELAAFHGVLRLKACPETYRQRIGADHRLLFRMTADRLVIVDLINRRDLDRRIKAIVAAGE